MLAIFISCLGVLGLSSLTIRQRVKEIGIRKVLGASAGRLVLLLVGDIMRLVVIALLVAIPLAYMAINRWLQEFAYRVDFGIGTMVLSGLLTMALAMMAVGYQTLRASIANPVESLRQE